MKIRPMGAELFHADRRSDGRTNRETWQLFTATLRTRVKKEQ